jgi:transposase InsO family protein
MDYRFHLCLDSGGLAGLYVAAVIDLFSRRAAANTPASRPALIADHGTVCSRSRSGNVWDIAAMESFFSSLKNERRARKVYRTRDEAKADVFDYTERFYNPKPRHSTINTGALWSSKARPG